MGSNPDQEEASAQMSRRRWLTAAGAVGAATLAGCTGGEDDNNNNQGSTSGVEDETDNQGSSSGGEDEANNQSFNMAMTTYPPTDMNFNNAAPSNTPNIGGNAYRDWAYADLGSTNAASGDFDLGLLEDYTYNLDQDSPNVELTFPEGWSWWPSGNDLTAEDYATQLRLGKYGVVGMTDMSSTVESLEVVNDQTLRLNLKTANINKTIWLSDVTGTLTTEHERYVDSARDLAEADGLNGIEEIDQTYGEDVNNEDAVQQAVNRIGEMSIDEPFGYMPFECTEVNQQEFVFELNEDHPAADHINWSGVNIKHMSSDAAQQAFVNGRIDFQNNVSEQLDLPDFVERIMHPLGVGPWLAFQMGGDGPTSNVHFRRAVMHLVDRTELATALGAKWDPIDVPCGLHAGQEDKWLSDPDSFIQYEPSKEKAAKELRAGGWKQDGDKWVDENGDPLEVTVKGKSGATPWVATAEIYNARLQEFGISSELLTEESSTYHGSTLPEGNYDIAVRFGGGWTMYPYFSLNAGLASDRARGSYNIPKTLSVPPIGKPDAEPTEEVDLRALADEIAQTADEDRVQELVEKLAWVWNYHIPFGCATEQMGDKHMNSERWKFPTDGAKVPGGTPRPGWMAVDDVLNARD